MSRATCERKRRWETKAAAKLALRRHKSNVRFDEMRAYRCPYCNWFHLGHKDTSPDKYWDAA